MTTEHPTYRNRPNQPIRIGDYAHSNRTGSAGHVIAIDTLLVTIDTEGLNRAEDFARFNFWDIRYGPIPGLELMTEVAS